MAKNVSSPQVTEVTLQSLNKFDIVLFQSVNELVIWSASALVTIRTNIHGRPLMKHPPNTSTNQIRTHNLEVKHPCTVEAR